jgi:hypothetical protein
MSLLTGCELEFLASLRTSWSRLYWNELARLLKEDDKRGAAAIRTLEKLHSEFNCQILGFGPEYRRRDKDRRCQDALVEPAPETVR